MPHHCQPPPSTALLVLALCAAVQELPALSADGLANPIWKPEFHVRDPAVAPTATGYDIYFSRYKVGAWSEARNWTIGHVTTADFRTFNDLGDVSPTGCASPARPVSWHGRSILAYQRYPVQPVELVYSASADGRTWSPPATFLAQANALPWNTRHRTIDPTLVVDGGKLYCLFVGTSTNAGGQVNLAGLAVTEDADLGRWTILSQEQPLIGPTPDSPDGAENIDVVRADDHWLMIYSKGLRNQHLAYAVSTDLVAWTFKDDIAIDRQWWMRHRYGAPSVWREGGRYWMLLMGEDAKSFARVGLLSSPDGIQWTPLPATGP